MAASTFTTGNVLLFDPRKNSITSSDRVEGTIGIGGAASNVAVTTNGIQKVIIDETGINVLDGGFFVDGVPLQLGGGGGGGGVGGGIGGNILNINSDELLSFHKRQKIIAPNAADNDGFSHRSIAMDKDAHTMVIGAYRKNNNTGTVYIYTRTTDEWTLLQQESGGDVGEYFGASVAISPDGSVIVVGVPGIDTCEVLTLSAGVFNRQSPIESPSTQKTQTFGMAVAVHSERIAIGEPASNKVHIYDAGGSSLGILVPSEPISVAITPTPRYGLALSMTATKIAISAPLASRVYTYEWDEDDGFLQSSERLLSYPGSVGSQFGASLSLSPSHLVIGAPLFNSGSGYQSGSVFVTSWDAMASEWSAFTILVSADTVSSDNLGTSVAIDSTGQWIVTGATGDANVLGESAGSVYMFYRPLNEESWTYTSKGIAWDGATNSGMGQSVAVSEGAAHVLVGAATASHMAVSGGAVYYFEALKTPLVYRDDSNVTMVDTGRLNGMIRLGTGNANVVIVEALMRPDGDGLHNLGTEAGRWREIYGERLVLSNDDSNLYAMYVVGSSSIVGDLTVSGSLDFQSGVSVSGEATFSSNVEIQGTLDVLNGSTVTGTVDIIGTLDVSSYVTLSSNVNVLGKLDVTNDVLLSSNVSVLGTLVVSDEVTFASNLKIHGILDVVDEVTFASNVGIQGTLDVIDIATFSSNVGIQGTLDVVDIATFASNISIEGTLDVVDIATFSSNVGIQGTIDVVDIATFSSNVSIQGTLDVVNIATFSSNVGIQGTLDVADVSTFSSNVGIQGTLDVVDIATFASNISIEGTLDVVDIATFSSNVGIQGTIDVMDIATFSSNVGIQGTLDVAYVVTFSSNVSIQGTLDVTDEATFSSNVGIQGTLDVTNIATFSSVVSIQGETTFSSNVEVQGSLNVLNGSSVAGTVDIMGTLDVSSYVTLSSNVNVLGKLDVTNDVLLSSNVSVLGTLVVSDEATLSSNLVIHGTIDVADEAAFSSNVGIQGTLDVASEATFSSNVLANGPVRVQVDQADEINLNCIEVFGTNTTSNTYNVIVAGHSSSSNFVVKANGNVGIGMSNPTNLLQVGSAGGFLRISNGNADYSMIGSSNSEGASNTRIVISGNSRTSSNGLIEYISTSNGSHRWFVNSSNEALRIASNGFVGMGTTNPQFMCHTVGTSNVIARVEGASGASGGEVCLQIYNSESTSYLTASTLQFNTGYTAAGTGRISYLTGLDGASHMSFQVSNVEHMRVNSAGNVGIGITDPSSKLHVSGSSLTKLCITSVNGYSNTTDSNSLAWHSNDIYGSIEFGGSSGSDGSGAFGGYRQFPVSIVALSSTNAFTASNTNNNVSGRLEFRTLPDTSGLSNNGAVPLTRMTVAANGNVGIGTISPSNTLQVNGSAAFSSNVQVLSVQPNYIQGEATLNNNDLNVWYNLGTFSGIAGSRLELKLIGGSGYDRPSGHSGGCTTIYVSINNNNTASIANASATWITMGAVPVLYDVKLDGSDYSFKVVALMNTFPSMTMIPTVTPGATFTRVFASNVDPGNDSSNVRRATHLGSFLNGSVGIGTTNPNARVHIHGSGGRADLLTIGSASQPGFSLSNNSNGMQWNIYSAAPSGDQPANNLVFRNDSNGNNCMQITSNGTVGIGTGTTSARLHLLTSDTLNTLFVENVGGGGGFQPAIRAKVNASNSARNILQLENNDGITFVANDYGYVGIGTTLPRGKIDCSATFRNRIVILYQANEATSDHKYIGFGVNSSALRYQVDHIGSSHIFYSATSETTSTELMRINGNGNVGIGTTNPSFPLDVFGSSNEGITGRYYNNTESVSYGSNVFTVSIRSARSVWAQNNGSFISSSDRRIKCNFQDIQDDECLEQLRQIQNVKYEYIDKQTRGSHTVYGFIAQDVGDVIPYAITKQKEFIPNIFVMGNATHDETNTYITINKDIDACVGDKIRLVDEQDKSYEIFIKDITGYQITCNKIDISDKIFVFGKEVNDFHTLDKQAIFTVAVGALQQLDRQVQSQALSISALQEENTEKTQKILSLESALATYEQRLSALEAAINNA
jgi:hypothetical protein